MGNNDNYSGGPTVTFSSSTVVVVSVVVNLFVIYVFGAREQLRGN